MIGCLTDPKKIHYMCSGEATSTYILSLTQTCSMVKSGTKYSSTTFSSFSLLHCRTQCAADSLWSFSFLVIASVSKRHLQKKGIKKLKSKNDIIVYNKQIIGLGIVSITDNKNDTNTFAYSFFLQVLIKDIYPWIFLQ